MAADDLAAGRLVSPFPDARPEMLETARVDAFREWLHYELIADM